MMAESDNRNFSISLRSAIDEIDTYSDDLSDEYMIELRESLQEVMAISLSDRFNNALSSNSIETSTELNTAKVIKALMKFTAQAVLEVGKLVSMPARLIFIVVGAVITYVFSEDIVSEVAEEFRLILDEKFIIRCRATSHKFKNCIRYLNGLPDPRNLDSTQRKSYLDRLASDNPINTGIEEIAELNTEIQQLVNAKDLPDMVILLNKVQMYCCLTTFRELFLLARFAIENEYDIDTQSIINVLEGQRHDDLELLRFLYKPNTKTVDLFLKYNPNEWSVVAEFLRRRRLTSNLDGFDNKLFKIWSMYYPDSLISSHDLGILTCLRCHAGTEGDHTIFRLRMIEDGVFTIHPLRRPGYFVYNKDWVRMSTDPARRLREWRIVRIEPRTTNESASFLLMLRSMGHFCMYSDFTRRVYVWERKSGDRKCFWRLQMLDDGNDENRSRSGPLNHSNGEVIYNRRSTI